jgi:hypothetical protein
MELHQVTWNSKTAHTAFIRTLSCFACNTDSVCNHYKLGKGKVTFKGAEIAFQEPQKGLDSDVNQLTTITTDVAQDSVFILSSSSVLLDSLPMDDNELDALLTDIVAHSNDLDMNDDQPSSSMNDLVIESVFHELNDNHLAATKKTDLVIDSGYLEMHDTHLPTTTNDLVRESGGVEMNDNHLPTTVTDCCSPHSRMNIEKQNLSKKKRKKRQHEYGGGKKKKKQQTTNKNQDANGTAVACYECGIVEHSYEDNQLSEDWIQCCKTGCNTWCHESCGEKGGILDDAEFFCAKCALTI